MDCCSLENVTVGPVEVAEVSPCDKNAPAPRDDPKHACVVCKGSSRPVTRKTMLLMLKPDRFDEVEDGDYRFCSSQECCVVYFTESSGRAYTTVDIRVRVGLKEKVDPIPLCYCFGFDEADARSEITATGGCSIPQRISALIKGGMCDCPARNPSGSCCLGEVNRAVKKLLELTPEIHSG